MPRVAITTASDRVRRHAEALSDHGLVPVLLPCIEIVPSSKDVLEEARAAAGTADWLLLTSPRTVRITWSSGVMPDVPVAAVGATTAREAAGAGGRIELVGKAGAAELAETLAPMVGGKLVAFPHAAGAQRATAHTLGEAGARVLATAVYTAVPVAPAGDPVDAVIFASPSAVTGWCLSRSLDHLNLAVIGDTTGQALAGRGYPAHVTPDRPGAEALASALAEHLRERSPA